MHPIVDKGTRLAAYLAGWFLIGLIMAITMQPLSADRSWWQSMATIVPLVVMYGLMSLPVWFLCRVFPLSRASWISTLTVMLAAGAVTGGAWMLLATGWSWLLGQWHDGFPEPSPVERPLLFAMSVVFYLLAAAVHYLIIAVETSRQVERRAFEMKWLAKESELRALRTQIDPHFLFNSLNSISALTARDPAAARRMLLMLSEFFRRSLKLGAERLITLEEEIDLCRQYLDIERVRFGDRLRVHIELEDGARGVLVPPLCLQPLVENGVRHGIAQLVEGGVVNVRARRQGSLVFVDIVNDTDDESRGSSGAGIGLENVRQRLENYYSGGAAIDAGKESGRFSVRVTVPAEAP